MPTVDNVRAPAQEENEKLSSLLDFALVVEDFLLNHDRQFRFRGNDAAYWICGLPNPFAFPNLRDDRQKPPSTLFAILKGICQKAYAVKKGRFVKAKDFRHDRHGWWVKTTLAEIKKWGRCTYEQWRSAKSRLVAQELLKIQRRSIPVGRGRYEGSEMFLQVNFGRLAELLDNIDHWKLDFPEVPEPPEIPQPDRVGVNPNPNINIMGRAVGAVPCSSPAPLPPSLCQTDVEMAPTQRKKENDRDSLGSDFFKDKRKEEGNGRFEAEKDGAISPEETHPNGSNLKQDQKTGAWGTSKALWSMPGDTATFSPERLLAVLPTEYAGDVAIETTAGQLATAVEPAKVIAALDQFLNVLAERGRAVMAVVSQVEAGDREVSVPEAGNEQAESIPEQGLHDTTAANDATAYQAANAVNGNGQSADVGATALSNTEHSPRSKDLSDIIREEEKRRDIEADDPNNEDYEEPWQFKHDMEGREIVYELESHYPLESVTRSMARRIQQLRFSLPAHLCLTPGRVREFLEDLSLNLLDGKAGWLARVKLGQLLTKPAWLVAAKYLLRAEHRDVHNHADHTMVEILSLREKAEELLKEICQPGFLSNWRQARWGVFANTGFLQDEAKLEQFLYAWCQWWPEERLAPLREQAKEVIMKPDWAVHFHETDPILHWSEGLGLMQAEVDKIEAQAKADLSQFRRYVKRALLKGDFSEDEAANMEKLLQNLCGRPG